MKNASSIANSVGTATKAAYGNHKHIAIKRGIHLLFTFEQWSEWWLTDDRWSRRGRRAGQLQMGRKGNSGPYAPENVECVTKEQKQRSQLIALSVSAFSPERRAEAAKKSGLARRGENNRRAKSVVTPLRTFVTVKAAAKVHGIGQSTVRSWPRDSVTAGVTWPIPRTSRRPPPARSAPVKPR